MPINALPALADQAEPLLPLVHAQPCASDEDGGKDEGGSGGSQIGVATKTRAKAKKPSQYKALMLNDDYTPMEFVVLVLKRFFGMDLEQATRVMLHAHAALVDVEHHAGGRLRNFHLRSGRNQGQSGDGLRPPEPAPAAMHA